MAKRKVAQQAPDRIGFLKKITDAFGPSSFEGDVRKVFREEVEGLCDNVFTDGLGSIIATKKGTTDSPKVLIAGHMDEVGFMVRGITSKGYIKFSPIGGWWGHVLLGQKVVIRTREGKDIIGIVGSKAPHVLSADERTKVLDLDKMFIDVGSWGDYNAPKELGIRPGDPIIPLSDFTVMGDGKILLAKAWDNRIGVAAAIDVLRELAGEAHPNTYFAAGTVQEEVGLRGAGTCAFAVEPDIAIAVDVTIACDTPGSDDTDFAEQCGKGPSISVMDGSLLPNPALRDFVFKVAEEEKIPFQFGSLTKGGTDGGKFAVTKSGIPSLTISVATRYIHSHSSSLHIDDYENLVKLLTAVVKKLDARTVAQIRNM